MDYTSRADVTKPPPERFIYESQPYGRYTLGDCRWDDYKGTPVLVGTVVEGTTTSRLFQHTATRSAVGEVKFVYGIKQFEIEQGSAVRCYL